MEYGISKVGTENCDLNERLTEICVDLRLEMPFHIHTATVLRHETWQKPSQITGHSDP